MHCFAFHLMPWDRLPADFDTKYESAWTWLPNSIYEPEHGHTLYNRYLDELCLADELGFDGVCVNEHHQNAYGTMPSPNLMGSILARQTKRVKIAVIGNALPLYNPPTRVAEEFAMIDVISGGRLIAGLVVGGGPEYYSFTVNPTHARTMFAEAMDLVLRAWTEPGPFEHYGEYWKLKYVNPWPRPLQQPHPPVWCPSQGSSETVEWAARRRFPYLMVFTPIRRIAQVYGEYREACRRYGYTASRYQLTVNVPIVVAPSDAQAEAIARKHVMWVFNTGLRMHPPFWRPPGYMTEASLRRILESPPPLPSELTFEQADREGYIVYGSPATVRDKLRVFADELQAGILCSGMNGGSHEATLEMMQLFAEAVMPHFREDAAVDETAGIGRPAPGLAQ
jgi:alkanesulfonate monooxygenase SsuD/methylene tetrahydromethanopterin reductase-like flavin-dependent oxidoreductase (luciferase family)